MKNIYCVMACIALLAASIICGEQYGMRNTYEQYGAYYNGTITTLDGNKWKATATEEIEPETLVKVCFYDNNSDTLKDDIVIDIIPVDDITGLL